MTWLGALEFAARRNSEEVHYSRPRTKPARKTWSMRCYSPQQQPQNTPVTPIGSFTKAIKEEVDKFAARFQADSQMELLSILDEQEISSLRAEYTLEKEPVPQSCLDTPLDRVV
ncbi:hypothetical protein DL95DRAFT_451104 [Leptodontidium sp. 2 PMI_412]|nr:hypothetical protein DL95DRAFT_451104 [Leptodontidium sp. 2 PMI_412]